MILHDYSGFFKFHDFSMHGTFLVISMISRACGNPANREDQDDKAEFHQGVHCLHRNFERQTLKIQNGQFHTYCINMYGIIHQNEKRFNIKRKICTEKRLNTSLKDLSLALTNHGRHGLFSFLSSLPISVLHNLELEANKLYDRANKLYKAALLTRCYVQHFLSPYIDSEVNHKRHFIKIPFINKGIDLLIYIVSSRIIQ